MIQFKITLNGQEETKSITTSWDDLTFSNYLWLLDFKGDNIDLISHFTDIPRETILKAKIEGVEALFVALEFLNETPDWSGKPQTFMGELMPEDITFNAIAPYQDCRQIMQEAKTDNLKEFISEYAKLCAIYVYAIRNNWEGYDYDKAMELVPEVMQQPAREVVGLGSFFIVKFSPLRKSINPSSLQEGTPQKK